MQIGQNFDGFKRLYGKFITSTGPSVRWDKIEKLPPDAVSKGQNIFYPDIKLFISPQILPYSELYTPDNSAAIRAMLDKLVVIKLNGGLGTSMGCR